MKPRVRLRKSSVKVYRRLQDGPVLPQWVRVVPYALGLFAFIFISLQLFAKDGSTISDIERARLDSELSAPSFGTLAPGLTTPTATTDQALPATTVPPATGSTGPVVSSGGSTTPPPSTTSAPAPEQTQPSQLSVSLPFKTGSVVQVPVDALDMARNATVARFTGNFEGVLLGPSVSVPLLPRTWKNPYVGDPIVNSVGDGVFVLRFRVDPDRDGVEPIREILTAVSYVPGQGWVWLGV
jgi:hypothetical protein